jgi:uncharacterized membrane protein (GlpM family)
MSLFALRIIASFVVGGLFISLQTLIAERVPLKWRGVILTIPSTLALGLFFIGISSTSGAVTAAASSISAELTSLYIFGIVFAVLSRRGLFFATVGSIVAWFVSALVLIIFPIHSLGTIFLIGIPGLVISYGVLNMIPHNHEIIPVPFVAKHIFVRALFGGFVIALSVIFAKYFGNIWGGIFSAYPAVFTTTLIIYYLVHGKNIIPGITKSFLFPGVPGYVLYALAVMFTFPRFGIWLGTLFSYAVFAVYIFVYQKIKEWHVVSRSQKALI